MVDKAEVANENNVENLMSQLELQQQGLFANCQDKDFVSVSKEFKITSFASDTYAKISLTVNVPKDCKNEIEFSNIKDKNNVTYANSNCRTTLTSIVKWFSTGDNFANLIQQCQTEIKKQVSQWDFATYTNCRGSQHFLDNHKDYSNATKLDTVIQSIILKSVQNLVAEAGKLYQGEDSVNKFLWESFCQRVETSLKESEDFKKTKKEREQDNGPKPAFYVDGFAVQKEKMDWMLKHKIANLKPDQKVVEPRFIKATCFIDTSLIEPEDHGNQQAIIDAATANLPADVKTSICTFVLHKNSKGGFMVVTEKKDGKSRKLFTAEVQFDYYKYFSMKAPKGQPQPQKQYCNSPTTIQYQLHFIKKMGDDGARFSMRLVPEVMPLYTLWHRRISMTIEKHEGQDPLEAILEQRQYEIDSDQE